MHPNAPHPEVIQKIHLDSLDDPLASRQLSSSPQVQVDSLNDRISRDPSSGHPCIPVASMDLSDPVPCLATPGVFCRRVLPSSPQPDIASLDGMSTRVLIASMDTDGSDVTPGCRGTNHLPSQHVAFSPMSEDERLLSMSTIPSDFSLPPPACEVEPMVAFMHSGGVPAYQRAPAQNAPIPDTQHQHMWLLSIAFLHQVIGGCCSPVWTLMSHALDHTHMWIRLTVVVLQPRKCLSPAWTLILPIRVHNHMWLHMTVVVLHLRK